MRIKSRFFPVFLAFVCYTFAQTPQYVKQLANLNDNQHLEYCALNILRPRVVGTPGHEQVKEFIKKELQSMDFSVDVDQFVAPAPIFGNLTFTNIIGKWNPDADEFFTLACHYDSKYFPKNPNFIGATDSAIPCAIILNIAKVLHSTLKQDGKDIGLMVIFFDGEEAFLNWNEQDSIYGSRHLAHKMSNSITPLRGTNELVRDIDRIGVLVLLDLIGGVNPKFFNFYQITQPLHSRLVSIERKLAQMKLLEGKNYIFFAKTINSAVDDDHRPFLKEDVPILHLITVPFPKQWHTKDDDANHLHWPTIRNFNKILRVLTFEYLSGFF